MAAWRKRSEVYISMNRSEAETPLTDPDRILPAAPEAPDAPEPPRKAELEGAVKVSLEPTPKIVTADPP